VQLDGGNTRGSFDATVTYAKAVKHGASVRLFRFEHRIVGGVLASYGFEVALEHAPAGCVIRNMMPWPDAQQSLRIGSWPGGGFNLRSDTGPISSVRDASLAANCRGVLGFAVVAVPQGGQPIVKHIAITVT
jgi:hypothetical protein